MNDEVIDLFIDENEERYTRWLVKTFDDLKRRKEFCEAYPQTFEEFVEDYIQAVKEEDK